MIYFLKTESEDSGEEILVQQKRPQLLKKLYKYLPQFQNSRYFSLIKDFYKNHLNNYESWYFSHFVRWAQFNQVSSYFNFRDDAHTSSDLLIEEFLNHLGNDLEGLNYDEKAQLLEFETLLSNYLLSSQGDRMSMANSVEGRYPYLGNSFVESMCRIPTNKKAIGIKAKSLFRNELSKYLPKELANRPKIAYQAPEARAFYPEGIRHQKAQKLLDRVDKITIINKNNLLNLDSKIIKSGSYRLGLEKIWDIYFPNLVYI